MQKIILIPQLIQKMKIKIKKTHEDAVIPTYSKPGDAGMDLTAVSKSVDEDGNIVYGTGLAFEIPKGYVGLLFPRSSNSKKTILLSNSVGVLDSGFRGEVLLKFKAYTTEPTEATLFTNYFPKSYEVGERVGQIIVMPYPQIEFEEVQELSDTERGEGGFGSTGS